MTRPVADTKRLHLQVLVARVIPTRERKKVTNPGVLMRAGCRGPSRARRAVEPGPWSTAWLMLLLFLFLLAACGLDSGDPQGGASAPAEPPVHSLDPATHVAVQVAGPVELIFGFETSPIEAVRALGWTPDGRILLADAGRALLFLPADGDSLQVLSGSGEGPGEFRQTLMAAVTVTGGVVHFDPVLNRVTELSDSLEVLRLWSPEPGLDPGSLFAPMALTAQGALLGVPMPVGSAGAGEAVRPSPRRDESVLWRYAPVLHVTESGEDTMTEVPVVRCRSDEAPDPTDRTGGPASACTPEGDMAAMTSGEHGTVVAPLDWAEALVFGTDLEPVYSVRVDDSEAEAFSKVLTDDRGRLWLGHWGSPEWWVVDQERASRMVLPDGFELWDVADDRALGVVRGPLDVQRVGVLELPPVPIAR